MIPQVNNFTTYDFTDDELIEACKLTHLQKAFIQHQKGLLAIEKVEMKFDPLKQQDFLQNEAYVAGQIAAYDFLLGNADIALEKIRENLLKMQDEAKRRATGIYQAEDLNKVVFTQSTQNQE